MFIILGLLILIASFVIALVSLIGEQRQMTKVREKRVPKGLFPVTGVSGQEVLQASDKGEKIPKEPVKQEVYPWEQKEPEVGEGRGRKFDKVTISIKDLVNSSKRELDT